VQPLCSLYAAFMQPLRSLYAAFHMGGGGHPLSTLKIYYIILLKDFCKEMSDDLKK